MSVNGQGILGGLALVILAAACVSGPSPKDVRQAEIQYDLGVNDLKGGRLQQALREFEESVKLNPGFAQAQHGLGLAYYMLADWANALRHFQKALEIKPEYSEVMNSIARLYINDGKFHEAVPLLRKALDDVFLPERYLAESNLGWALFQIGEVEEGISRVKNALAQNDKYCIGYQYLGLMHQARKEFDQAVERLRKLVEICPQYAEGHLNLGKVLLLAGDAPGGCKVLETCLQFGSMSPVGQDCDRLWRLTCQEAPAKGAGG